MLCGVGVCGPGIMEGGLRGISGEDEMSTQTFRALGLRDMGEDESKDNSLILSLT